MQQNNEILDALRKKMPEQETDGGLENLINEKVEKVRAELEKLHQMQKFDDSGLKLPGV